jgi:hypothetical protein
MAAAQFARSGFAARFPRTIAFAMVLGLAACHQSSDVGATATQCFQHWTKDGRDHYRFVVTDIGNKTVADLQIFLGEPPPREKYDAGQVRAMESDAFMRVIHDSLPFEYRESIDAGTARRVFVRSIFQRHAPAAVLLHERVAQCYIGAVRYADGSGWTHGVRLGVSGLTGVNGSGPFFLLERP